MNTIRFTDNNNLLVTLSGEITEAEAPLLRERLDMLIAENTFSALVLDLSQVTFLDSTAIGLILGRYKKLKNRNRSLYIFNPSLYADRLLSLSGVYSIAEKTMDGNGI